jgi:hypothetical protein
MIPMVFGDATRTVVILVGSLLSKLATWPHGPYGKSPILEEISSVVGRSPIVANARMMVRNTTRITLLPRLGSAGTP